MNDMFQTDRTIIKMPTLDGESAEEKRQEIKRYFHLSYKRYESLFTLIVNENAYFQKADPLRHPLIFYYGHTAVFYVNKCKLAKITDRRIDAKMESIFAVGVDEMLWDDLDEKHYDWPSLPEVQAYRDSVYTLMIDIIDRLPLELPVTEASPWWVILMGIEHENIHLETSSVLIRQLPLNDVRANGGWKACEDESRVPRNEILDVEEGIVTLGKYKDEKFFGWDNEYGRHQAKIPAFKAAKYLTSHAEYLEFVEAGGYHNDAYWCDEGKAWKAYSNAQYPLFWVEKENGFYLRTLAQEIPLPLSWPVEVNYLEAAAFCRYKSEKLGTPITLPTEDEYIRLRDANAVPGYSQRLQYQGVYAHINLEGYASSVPVDSYKQGAFYDIIGNVWQWTRTPIYPFENFKVHPMYDDFTVPTFDGKHNLMKGGSWISCGNLVLHESRYAFRRHFYQHAGFRYVQSEYEEKIVTDYYTKETIVAQYCHFGWGENSFGVPNYPAVCASIALEAMKDKPRKKALDIGCAIGRSTFELARGFDEVIGLDFSARFIQEAQVLKEYGVLRYTMPIEGEIEQFYEVHLKHFDLENICSKVSFWQDDACNLKPIYKGFDLIFAGNLIDRLYDPKKFCIVWQTVSTEAGYSF